MGLRERLENLVANPLVVESTDYDFAKGLLEYYNKKGSLTAGRRPWLDKLEEKYDPATYVDPIKGNPQGEKIVALLNNPEVAERDKNFLNSLKGAVARWGKLTDRQEYALNQIVDRYSEEGKTRRNEWAENYKGALREEAVIAARYYLANPPYYGDLAYRIVSEEDFVPSEKQFNAITKNKYAQKVIRASQSEALYPVGTLVEGRAGSPTRLRGVKAFVLKVDASPVINAARGTKRYLVLPVGKPNAVEVEERYIKRVKNLKK